MNLLLLEPAELSDGVARLTDRRADHARQVLDVQVGTRLRVGVVRGARGTGVVRAVGDEIAIEVTLEGSPDPMPPIDLVLAMPRPKALRRLLRTVGAMGVGRIDLVNAWRVDKSYFGSPAVQPDALRHELLLGCEQGVTTFLPDIAVHPRLMGYVEALAPVCGRVRVLLHPHAQVPLESVAPRDAPARTVAAVGPEGGWIEREIATFEDRGFRAATLGPQVLTTPTAVTALLAQIALLRRLGDGS